MAESKFIDTPLDMIAHPPAGNKGGPGVYNGEDTAPLSGYKRTSSPNAVPEKLRDGSVPKVDKEVVMADKFPKNM